MKVRRCPYFDKIGPVPSKDVMNISSINTAISMDLRGVNFDTSTP